MTLHGGWSGLLAVSVAVLVAYAPWLALRLAATGRLGRADLVAAPAASVVVLAWAGLALSVVGAGFGWAAALLVVVVACGLLLIRRLRRGRGPVREGRVLPAVDRVDVAAAVGVVVAGAFAVAWHVSPGWLSGVPRYQDDIWHGYLTALLVDGRAAAPGVLTPVDPVLALPVSPYPYGFHLLAALVASVAGMPQGLNAVGLLGSVVVGPVGAAAAARELFPRSRAAVLVAPLAMAGIGLFQVRLEAISPYALGVALIPGGIALVVRAARAGWTLARTTGLCFYVAGMVVIQPAAAISLLLVVLPFLLATLWGYRRRPDDRPAHLARRIGLAVLLTAGLALPWLLQSLAVAASTLDAVRPTTFTRLGALVAVLTVTDPKAETSLVLGLLVLAGTVAYLVVGRPRWLLVSWLGFVALYVVAATSSDRVRRALTGIWFTDWYRLSAVVAVLAALMLAGAVAALAARVGPDRRRLLVATVAGLVGVGMLLSLPGYRQQTISSRRGGLVTVGEREAYAWLAERLRPGERVVNSWRDGSTWAFTLDGVPVLVPYGETLRLMPDRAWMMQQLPQLGRSPRLTAYLRSLDARYAIVDSTRLAETDDPVDWFPAGSPYVQQVFRSGGTTVYRIDLERLPG